MKDERLSVSMHGLPPAAVSLEHMAGTRKITCLSTQADSLNITKGPAVVLKRARVRHAPCMLCKAQFARCGSVTITDSVWYSCSAAAQTSLPHKHISMDDLWWLDVDVSAGACRLNYNQPWLNSYRTATQQAINDKKAMKLGLNAGQQLIWHDSFSKLYLCKSK